MSISLRNIGGNALSILTSDVMNRATSFVIYAMVARKLGAFEFGQMSLALSLFYIFLIFAVSGVKTLLIREVAQDRSLTRRYLVNGCLIVGAMSFVSLAAVFGFVRAVDYVGGTKLVVLLLSLGILPSAISAVCEGIFQAWERMNYIAYVNVPTNLTKMTGAYLLLFWNRGLYTVILLLLAAFFTAASVELWLVLTRFQTEPAPGRAGPGAGIDLRFALATLRSASTFLGIDSTCAVAGNLNIILLSKLATEKEVGLYSAATQLMVPLLLVYCSIAQSIFPVMCRKIEPGLGTLRRIAEQAIEVLLALAVPTVGGIFFVGQWALSVLYKNPAFAQAAPALRIVAWMLVPQVFSSVLGQVLMATHREKITLKIAMIGGVLNVGLGWPLIRWYGLQGAASILVVTAVVGSILHYLPVAQLLSGISFLKIIWKPLVAAGCMAVYLAVAITRVNVFAGLSATLLYLAVFVVLALWTSGGPRQFKEQYLGLLPDKTAEGN
jgi:O-antigen/teichoic acid export membrane protein